MARKRIEFTEVRALASGKWGSLLSDLGPFTTAIEAARKSPRLPKHVACPFHAGKDGDGFRMFKDFEETGGGICNTCGAFPTGFDLLMKAHGGSISDAYDCVARELGMIDHNGAPTAYNYTPPKVDPRAERIKQSKQQKADDEAARILNDTRTASLAASAPEAEPLRLYLANRGLDPAACPPSIRMHPALPYYERKEGGKFEVIGTYPAMLAAVVDLSGKAITMHRTYLTPDGKKAPVPEVKKLMRTRSTYVVGGSAVRLGLANGPALAVTEGIENGLAVQAATGLPVWSGISATIMAKLEVPEHVRTVIVFADLDRKFAGQIHAQMLCERMLAQGREALFYLPPGPIPEDAKGVDWHDIWVQRGRSGFPQIYPRPQRVEAGAGTASVANFTPRPTSRLMG